MNTNEHIVYFNSSEMLCLLCMQTEKKTVSRNIILLLYFP